ncbi:pyridoxamine 5'-phosphate oxidase family protein [Anaerobacillus sp. MEB173]|uniref:pyridoxamine 5'-phosphate oxidase family protein n=1 Tax=Anaerobacillus sp. MEB173 TaxID=3383345 RepID=UPI003F90F7B5
MSQTDLKNKILQVIENNRLGVLSTIKGDKPHARYMMIFNEGLKLYTATSKETHKVEEIEKNYNVHIILGYQKEGDTYVEVEATANVIDTEELKKKFWNDNLKPWLQGPEDPNYVILEIKPYLFHLIESTTGHSETLHIDE